jgi:hypothetical protein
MVSAATMAAAGTKLPAAGTRSPLPPTSKEFQRLVREILAPALAGAGFSRPQSVGLGGWARDEGGSWSVAWVQLSRSNYGNTPEGYLFTVEVQLGDEPVAGTGRSRARLYGLLTDAERAEHLAIHNAVAVKARPRPAMLGEPTTGDMDWYLSDFRPRSAPFEPFLDVWFRYTDEEDARRWLAFVARVLPGAIDRFVVGARTAGEVRRPAEGG